MLRVGRQGVGPHEHRLARLPREVLELRLIAFEKGRATRRDHHDDAIDRWRVRNQTREIRIAELVHALGGRIDRVLRSAVGGQVNVDRRARLFVEHRHIEAGGARRRPPSRPRRRLTTCRCRRDCPPACDRRRRESRRRGRSSRQNRGPRSIRSARRRRGRRHAIRRARRCAKRPRGSRARTGRSCATISGLPALSAFSATRLNFSGVLTSSISSRKTSVLPSSSMIVDEVGSSRARLRCRW